MEKLEQLDLNRLEELLAFCEEEVLTRHLNPDSLKLKDLIRELKLLLELENVN